MTYEIVQEQIGRTRCDIRAEGCVGIKPDGEDWGNVVFQMGGAEARMDACPICMGAAVLTGPGIRERLKILQHHLQDGSQWRELFK